MRPARSVRGGAVTGRARSASLAMYPFAAARPEYERLWASVVADETMLPRRLSWPDDPVASWLDASVVVKQTCGWPLVTRLRGAVRVVGAFVPTVPGADGYRYRSVIVSTQRSVDPAIATAAYNSSDSLSGWVSLLTWSGRRGRSWRDVAVVTGSHVGSLEALQSGSADLASIDAVTMAHVERERPGLMAGLHVVGHGPLVPSLPVVAPAEVDDDVVDHLRSRLADVVAADAEIRRSLFVGGFVPLELDDYRRDLARLTDS